MAESVCISERRFPEVVGPIADHLMIQRGGLQQTGNKDAEWLARLPDGSFAWSKNSFIAIGIKPNQKCVVEVCMEIASRDLPVLSPQEERALA